VVERQTSFGESWEQVLELAAAVEQIEVEEGAQVRWRDTSDRTLAATVDALGKIAAQLHVPPQMLWEKIPGVTQQDIDLWKAEFDKGSPITQLQGMLERQAAAGGAAA
jgi:hypothetical protein